MDKKLYKTLLNKAGEYSYWYNSFRTRSYDPDSGLTWGEFYEYELKQYLSKSSKEIEAEAKQSYQHWFARVDLEDVWDLASIEERILMFYYANVIQDCMDRDW